MARFQLRVTQAGTARVVPLNPELEIFTIGREKGNHLQLAEPKASREHCQLVRRDAGYELQDLQSSNGTVVDGQRIRNVMLTPGMRFAIGATTLALEAAEAAVAGGGGAPRSGGGLARRKDLYVEILDGIRDRFFSIEAGVKSVSIGRDEGNTIVLQEQRSSRRHCLLEKSGAELVLRDLGSANGTRLNGKPVTESALAWGDVIEIGATRIVVGEKGAAEAAEEEEGFVGAAAEGLDDEPDQLELKEEDE